MSFASDNTAPVHPAILEAVAEASRASAASYGADPWTARAEALLQEVFETDCTILLVATGTAANCIGLAALTPPWGAIFHHAHAHILEDEAGAPEFYTGGARLLPLPGPHAKLEPETLHHAASHYSRAWVHGAQPFAVSITQASEAGAVYQAGEVAEVAEVCRRHGLKLHMDGARFANAVAATGAAPADLTWRAGVDMLSFGATKNGALAVEAVVCFDAAAAAALPHLRKRAGHLFSKHRFLSAQMAAYLEDGRWLALAAHANAMAGKLAEGLARAGFALLHPPEANEVFVGLPDAVSERLSAAGFTHYSWESDGPEARRFVTSWATTEAEVEAALALLA